MNIILPSLAKDNFLLKENEYNQFGGEGENISPEIIWSGCPSETKSYAITLYDPDAPTGSGFWHWVLYNIPANIFTLPKNIATDLSSLLPLATQSNNDFGGHGYGGPCPPQGDTHRYIFTIHALSIPKIDMDTDITNAILRFVINQNTILSSSKVTYYQR